jgi:hypothetical protein
MYVNTVKRFTLVKSVLTSRTIYLVPDVLSLHEADNAIFKPAAKRDIETHQTYTSQTHIKTAEPALILHAMDARVALYSCHFSP